ncbi:probable E3 ubiquitin-protein ligase RNF217 [Protopterus annectens]|uniref:probable E3 ubiquitin-protein ligase RNF217 n=1 Tax=Protopterus annectens TaxID=7888 RepID=UPI001CFB1F36|nr:probable E3 ubiquitin-protein ligase RNF217 [Protopterus annectens]
MEDENIGVTAVVKEMLTFSLKEDGQYGARKSLTGETLDLGQQLQLTDTQTPHGNDSENSANSDATVNQSHCSVGREGSRRLSQVTGTSVANNDDRSLRTPKAGTVCGDSVRDGVVIDVTRLDVGTLNSTLSEDGIRGKDLGGQVWPNGNDTDLLSSLLIKQSATQSASELSEVTGTTSNNNNAKEPGNGAGTSVQSVGYGTPGNKPVICTVYCIETDDERFPASSYSEQVSPSDLEQVVGLATPDDNVSHVRVGENGLQDPLPMLNLESQSGLGSYNLFTTCRICLEEQMIKPLPCCKKTVCDECLKNYLSSQVYLGQAQIKCPITECKELLDEMLIVSNLRHDEIVKYKYFLELSRMDMNTKPCPQCKHFTVFENRGHFPTPTKIENKYKIQCPECQFIWCFRCHAPWHEGLNCKDYRKGDKLLRHWASEIEHGQRNAQKCPKCRIHIQRTEGCDHMMCTQCNTNFCYRCGERYRQLRFFGDHTSNLSIFGCKYRYLPERPHLRRLVRGSVCAGKLLIAPLLLIVVLALGAVAFVIGVFAFPVYFLCKRQRKRTRTGMPM